MSLDGLRFQKVYAYISYTEHSTALLKYVEIYDILKTHILQLYKVEQEFY
jgi:hypothetical protein